MSRGRPKGFDRETALEAAVEVFWEHGYEGASMARLVEAMGVGRQSVYDTYGDKRALFLEVVDRFTAQREAALDATLGEAEDGPRLDALGRLLESLAERTRQTRRGCLLINTATDFGAGDEEIVARLVAARATVEGRLRDTLEDARRAGEVPADTDASAWAATLITAFHGAMVLARTPDGPQRIETTLANLWTTLTGRPWRSWAPVAVAAEQA